MVEIPSNMAIDQSRLDGIESLAREWRRLFPKNADMRLAQRSYDEDFLVRMTYNSNAIEGSTLTLAETEIVYEGEFVPDKPGKDQIAARGIFEGAAFMVESVVHGVALTEALLRDLHERCALDLQPAARGMYRNAPAIIRASRTVPTAPLKIREEMANLFYRYEESASSLHPLIAIPWFHAALESVHPFADGNGRTGRLWMNAQLSANAYPPICIKVDNGIEYKQGLESWQVEGDPDPFMGLFLDCLEDELEKRIAFLSQTPHGEESIGLSERAAEAMGVICNQPSISAKAMGKILGISERQTQRILRNLQDKRLIERRGAPKNGIWLLSE